jgi:hypothetical protein
MAMPAPRQPHTLFSIVHVGHVPLVMVFDNETLPFLHERHLTTGYLNV